MPSGADWDAGPRTPVTPLIPPDVPGLPDAPVVATVNDTTIVIVLQPPAYAGGYPVTHYGLLASHLNFSVYELPEGSRLHVVMARDRGHTYLLRGRAVNALGPSASARRTTVLIIDCYAPRAPQRNECVGEISRR